MICDSCGTSFKLAESPCWAKVELKYQPIRYDEDGATRADGEPVVEHSLYCAECVPDALFTERTKA